MAIFVFMALEKGMFEFAVLLVTFSSKIIGAHRHV